jgi:hypothetical protein
MAYDFRANQVRLNRIISSGSIPILIYPSSSAADFAGNLVPTFSTTAIGTDVFLYVSGSSAAKTVFGGDVVISGSLAQGDSTVASGVGSHAQGYMTTASGDFSHAEGFHNVASGWRSHAEGFYTTADGYNAHSEGEYTAAGAAGAHAEGLYSQALAGYSHAEGNSTEAHGIGSHAEGYYTKTYGTGSHAGGLYTEAYGSMDGAGLPANVQTVFGKYNVRNNYDSLFVIGNGVGDTNPQRSDILRVNSGSVEITGSLSVIGGISGSISGTVSGLPFIIAGPNISASYNSLGQWEITGSAGSGGTSNDFFFSRTLNIIEASGSLYLSGALRATTLSASLGAIITGSVVQGTGSVASGDYSHAEGNGTQATRKGAHAEGANTTASGEYSHAEGVSTTASKLYSHAEGVSTEANGEGSHSEGQSTIAQGDYSHAEGIHTLAVGEGSHASGWGTEANADHQSALGTYNLQNNTTSIFVIGDGNNSSNRHDLLRAESGNIQVTGSLISPQITGSIKTVDGTNLYIVGSGITVNYNSLGQYELTSSGGGSSFSLSGSTIIYGDGTNRGSGSISGLFDITTNRIGKYEVDIVAISFDDAAGAGWKYSTTTFSASPSSFRFIGINELAEDLSSPTLGWEVNFNDSGTLDVTGSTSASGTFFYARVVNKMMANFNSIIS